MTQHVIILLGEPFFRKSRIALAIGVGLVATVTAGGMALAGGRGYTTVNEPNNAELRPTVHVESKAGGVEVIQPINDGLTGRVIEMQQSDSSFELPPLNPPPTKILESEIEYIKTYVSSSEDFDAYTTQVGVPWEDGRIRRS